MINLKRISAVLAAFALVLTACEPNEPDLSFPSVTVDESDVAVGLEASTFSFSVISNRPWRVTSDVPWIALDPDSGNGGVLPQTVTVSVLENKSYDRSGHVVVDIVYDSQTIVVNQTGIGRPEDFILYFNDFDKTDATQTYGTSGSSWPYLDQFDGWKNETGTGVGDAMAYAFGSVSARTNSASNSTYSDYDGSGHNNLLFAANGYFAVQNLTLGSFRNFKLSFGSEKYLNDNPNAPFDPAEFLVYASADGRLWVPVNYEFKGTAAGRWNLGEAVFSVPESTASLSFYIKANISSSAYRFDDFKIEVAEEAGTVLDFSNGVEIKIDGGSSGGGGGDTGDVKAVTVAAFNAAPESSTQVYELVGTIGGTINTTYGNFDLSDETGTVYVYGLTSTNLGYGKKNDQSFASLNLKADDKIKIRGYRGSFNDKIEVMYAWFIEKVSGGSGGGGGTGTASGTGTLSDPYNALGAAAAVANLTWTSTSEYQKTDKVYVKGKISRIASNGKFAQSGDFGNASFYISEDGSQNGEFYCFRILYFGGEKYTNGPDIEVGNDVVVYGSLMNYRGNTPETVAGECNLYSLNGETYGGGGSGGGSGSGGGDTGDVKAVTVAAFNAAPESDTQVYELVGTIGGSINTTYGNFDLSDESGTVYVYGLTSTNLGYGAKNDKSFASLNLKADDKIKIRGYRGSFNDKIEVMYAWFIEKVEGGSTNPGTNPGGGGDQPTGNSIEWTTNSAEQTWSSTTDATLGAGFTASSGGMTVSYYKHTSTTAPVAPNANHIRVYKNSRLVISVNGKTIKSVVLTCEPKAGTTKYCLDMSVSDGSTAKADETNLTVSWSGSTSSFVADAVNGQVRIKKIAVTFE